MVCNNAIQHSCSHIIDDIIHYMRTEAPLLAPIFRSDGQARILSELLIGGDQLSVTELAARVGLAYPTVHREVGRLLDAGILVEENVGRTRVVQANSDSPLVRPLTEILMGVAGPVVLLRQELSDVEGIVRAFIFGSFAARSTGVPGPAPHDIDLMVIGTPDPAAIYDICDRVEESVHLPINPTILSPEEASQDSGFLYEVRNNPTLPIIEEQS